MYISKAATIERIAKECLSNERMFKLITQCIQYNEEPNGTVSLTVVKTRGTKCEKESGWWRSFYGRHFSSLTSKSMRYKYYKMYHRITVDELIDVVNEYRDGENGICELTGDREFSKAIVARRAELKKKRESNRESLKSLSILNTVFR